MKASPQLSGSVAHVVEGASSIEHEEARPVPGGRSTASEGVRVASVAAGTREQGTVPARRQCDLVPSIASVQVM